MKDEKTTVVTVQFLLLYSIVLVLVQCILMYTVQYYSYSTIIKNLILYSISSSIVNPYKVVVFVLLLEQNKMLVLELILVLVPKY